MPVTERAVEQKFLIAVDFGMLCGARDWFHTVSSPIARNYVLQRGLAAHRRSENHDRNNTILVTDVKCWLQAGGQHIIQDWPNEDSTNHSTTDIVPTYVENTSLFAVRSGTHYAEMTTTEP